MGIYSVQAVIDLAAAKKISHPAARVALFIAAKTLDFEGDDGTPPNTFWAGRDALALGLGNLAAEYDHTDDGNRAREAVYRAVKRALAELEREGMLTRELASFGRRTTYRLILPPPPSRRARARNVGDAHVPLGGHQ